MTLEDRPQADRGTRSLSPDFKVLLAASAMVALVVIGAVLAVAFILAMRSGADAVEGQARYAAAIDAAALHAKGMANNERGFLIDGDEDFISQMEGRSELVRASFTAALETADDGARATVVEAREAFERWLASVEEEIALFRSGDEAAAIEMSLGVARAQRWTYEGWLADAKSVGAGGFQDAAAAVDGTSTASTVVLLGYLIVAVLAAVTIALWIIRVVLRPAATLAHLLAESDDSQRASPA